MLLADACCSLLHMQKAVQCHATSTSDSGWVTWWRGITCYTWSWLCTASSLESSIPLVWNRPCHCRNPVHKLGPVDDIGIVEHAFLQGHHYELRVRKVCLDHSPNVLGVAQIQCSIHLQHHKYQPSLLASVSAISTKVCMPNVPQLRPPLKRYDSDAVKRFRYDSGCEKI